MWPPPLPSQKDPRGATAPFARLLPGEAASSPPVRSEADVFHADLRLVDSRRTVLYGQHCSHRQVYEPGNRAEQTLCGRGGG